MRGETILTLDGEDENVSSPAEGRTDDLVLGLLDVRHARERNVLIRVSHLTDCDIVCAQN